MAKQEKTAYEIRLTANALQNIDEITGYIAFVNHQPLNAVKVGDAILAAIERIGNAPFAYKECPEIPTKSKLYRQAVYSSWLIIYKISGKKIIVLGVIHKSRKPSNIKSLKKGDK